jgi:hypothetical protein
VVLGASDKLPGPRRKAASSKKIRLISFCNRFYEHKGGAPRDFVRVCGLRRFQRGLDEIKQHISAHSIRASFYSQDIDRLEAENADEVADEIAKKRAKLAVENDAIRQLEDLYDDDEVTAYWFDLKLHRDIGYVQHAEAIKHQASRSTSKAAHAIRRTGVRSWPTRQRSAVSLRATSSTSVRFDPSHFCLV